jgi:septation ring formation regulator EzrA
MCAEIKETFTAETQQIFNAERQAGNYRFLSSRYDIWFISEFMTAIGF